MKRSDTLPLVLGAPAKNKTTGRSAININQSMAYYTNFVLRIKRRLDGSAPNACCHWNTDTAERLARINIYLKTSTRIKKDNEDEQLSRQQRRRTVWRTGGQSSEGHLTTKRALNPHGYFCWLRGYFFIYWKGTFVDWVGTFVDSEADGTFVDLDGNIGDN